MKSAKSSKKREKKNETVASTRPHPWYPGSTIPNTPESAKEAPFKFASSNTHDFTSTVSPEIADGRDKVPVVGLGKHLRCGDDENAELTWLHPDAPVRVRTKYPRAETLEVGGEGLMFVPERGWMSVRRVAPKTQHINLRVTAMKYVNGDCTKLLTAMLSPDLPKPVRVEAAERLISEFELRYADSITADKMNARQFARSVAHEVRET